MSATHSEHVELPITGMTCASCANRIERKLNRLDGVSATVNYATERATVDYDPEVAQPEDLLGAVEAAGYQAVLPAAEPARNDGGHEHHDLAEDETAALRRRLVISAVLSFPVLLMAMVPALQFDNWQWLSLQLATPVVLWGAWPFHKAAWTNAQARDRDDGHPHLRRRARRVAVVAVLPVPRRRRDARHADAVRAHPRTRRRQLGTSTSKSRRS